MMEAFQSDFFDISTGLIVCTSGLLAFVVSLFRLKTKDFTLLNFGLFAFFYGLRRLVEAQTMRTMVGVPFSIPYFHGLLTYALIIPLSAFVVSIYGRGLYSSLVWVYRSTIVYILAALVYDLLRPGPLADVAIYRPLAVVWGLVWIANVLFLRKERNIELRVLQFVILITLLFMIIDQLASMGILARGLNLEKPGYSILFLGLGFVGVHRFFSNERKLHSIEQEVEIARRIQESNLPTRESFPPTIDIAARYVPMTTVAGDFYDIQSKDKAGVGILIADVSGHGVGAALIGSMLKVSYASLAPLIGDPARVLTEINRILHGKIKDSFVTACSLFIDFRKKIIRYSCAGHPAPILMRKSSRTIVRLSVSGTIMGPFQDLVYKNGEVHFAIGDRLMLYTDGLIEAKNRSGELFEDDRLMALFTSSVADSPEASANRIIDEIFKWSGRSGEQVVDDDLTLIIADLVSKH